MEMDKENLQLSSAYIVYHYHTRKQEVTVKVVQSGCEELEEPEHQDATIGDKIEYKLMLSLPHSSGSHLGTLEEVCYDPGNARYRKHNPVEVNNAGVDGRGEEEMARFQMVVAASRTLEDDQSALDVGEVAGLEVVYRRGWTLILA